MKNWLPKMPPDHVRDTGISGVKVVKGPSKDASRMNSKKYRQRISDAESENSSSTEKSNEKTSFSLSNSFSAASEKELELKGLEILFNGRNAKLARKAQKEIAKRVKWTIASDDEEDSDNSSV
jgi:hypothetical protein